MPKSHHQPLAGWRRVVALTALGAVALAIVGWFLRALIQAPIPVLGATIALAGASAIWHYGWGLPRFKQTEETVRGLVLFLNAQPLVRPKVAA
jgi:hypothetical protein